MFLFLFSGGCLKIIYNSDIFEKSRPPLGFKNSQIGIGNFWFCFRHLHNSELRMLPRCPMTDDWWQKTDDRRAFSKDWRVLVFILKINIDWFFSASPTMWAYIDPHLPNLGHVTGGTEVARLLLVLLLSVLLHHRLDHQRLVCKWVPYCTYKCWMALDPSKMVFVFSED